MRRLKTYWLIVLVLSLGSSSCLLAQSLPADRFLDSVSARPVGDEVERDQFLTTGDALNNASAAEVDRVLPAVLKHTRSGGEAHERVYATGFLLMIAMRPDGADLLSSKSEEISSLIVDANPGIQKVAVAIMDYVIGKPATNKQPYLSASKAVMQRPQTPQEVVLVGMISALLVYGSSDPDALKSVLAFLHRDDLTPSTRSELVHRLGVVPGLPPEVNQYLVALLSDSDPHVRAAALVAYADSTTPYHIAAKDDRKS